MQHQGSVAVPILSIIMWSSFNHSAPLFVAYPTLSNIQCQGKLLGVVKGDPFFTVQKMSSTGKDDGVRDGQQQSHLWGMLVLGFQK